MEFVRWHNKYFETLSGVGQKKFVQELRIIKYLYVFGPKSNAEICRHLKISAPSSFLFLNELMNRNLIEKQGRGESIGGRKPDLYGIKDDALYVLGVEMGKYETKIAIFNAVNENITGIKSYYSMPLDQSNDTIDKLYNYATELIEGSGIDPAKLIAVGISVPGLVDSRKGVNYTYLNFGEKTLKDILQKKFNLPVFIENDAKAAALAEYRFGQAKGKKDVLSVFWDWGIGLGLIMDSKLYRGTSGFAGELSHIPIVKDGILCQCGKQGCLETIASGSALSRLALEGLKSRKTSIYYDPSKNDVDKIEARYVLDAANKGDQYAINILGEVGFNLGKGLAILIQLLNPELIILGGRIAEAGEYVTMPIQQSLNTFCMRQLKEHSSVVISDMGQNVCLMGAVAVVMENIFEYYIKTAAK
jgi:glucokinase-like ROK family protein